MRPAAAELAIITPPPAVRVGWPAESASFLSYSCVMHLRTAHAVSIGIQSASGAKSVLLTVSLY